jgi:hypothetical protein
VSSDTISCRSDQSSIAPQYASVNRQFVEMASVIQASMISSPLWHQFKCREITKNMRLLGLYAEGEVTDPAILAHLAEQQEYAAMLLEVGEGVTSDYRVQALKSEPETGSTLVRLPLIITPITNHQDALHFIYPGGFNKHTMHKSSILASTNEIGVEWNTMIQDHNPNESREYLSVDFFDAVDDPHKYIAGMMSTEVLNDFYHSGVPSHKLVLKVDDICIVMRSIHKRDGLSNNTRVRITAGKFSIRVKTLDAKPQYHVMSRIRFQFALPWGHEVGMTRTQFPLRLAYCMTFNKAQGQEWERVLVDLRNPAFTHGHLYDVLSRIRLSCNIRAFCDEDKVIQEHPITRNVVYTALKIVVNNI